MAMRARQHPPLCSLGMEGGVLTAGMRMSIKDHQAWPNVQLSTAWVAEATGKQPKLIAKVL
eukprot:SM000098S25133  [mRNA]  locus=s98:382597:383728:- [translate_table: standard]